MLTDRPVVSPSSLSKPVPWPDTALGARGSFPPGHQQAGSRPKQVKNIDLLIQIDASMSQSGLVTNH